jgi:5-methylcytosine-specific restriction enzyme B
VQSVIDSLTTVNEFLAQAQLQVGYRIRDEISLFVLHARDLAPSFTTREGEPVDPLDLAIEMKVLPRLVGGSNAIRFVIIQLLSWALEGNAAGADADTNELLRGWKERARPAAITGARFPRTAARLSLMLERMENEGFTSFWL